MGASITHLKAGAVSSAIFCHTTREGHTGCAIGTGSLGAFLEAGLTAVLVHCSFQMNFRII